MMLFLATVVITHRLAHQTKSRSTRAPVEVFPRISKVETTDLTPDTDPSSSNRMSARNTLKSQTRSSNIRARIQSSLRFPEGHDHEEHQGDKDSEAPKMMQLLDSRLPDTINDLESTGEARAAESTARPSVQQENSVIQPRLLEIEPPFVAIEATSETLSSNSVLAISLANSTSGESQATEDIQRHVSTALNLPQQPYPNASQAALPACSTYLGTSIWI